MYKIMYNHLEQTQIVISNKVLKQTQSKISHSQPKRNQAGKTNLTTRPHSLWGHEAEFNWRRHSKQNGRCIVHRREVNTNKLFQYVWLRQTAALRDMVQRACNKMIQSWYFPLCLDVNEIEATQRLLRGLVEVSEIKNFCYCLATNYRKSQVGICTKRFNVILLVQLEQNFLNGFPC